MTHEQKINYMRIAAGICNFGINTQQMDLLVSVYEGVLEREGEFNLRDASVIEVEVSDRERIRNTSKLLDKVSKKTGSTQVDPPIKKKKP